MGIKEDDDDEGNVKKYIGRTVKKYFKGYGEFSGEVISFNKARNFFKVKYADGDREELDLSELKAILVDVETKAVKENPKLKGAANGGGRKRKRDQPVKYRKGVVENGPTDRCKEVSQNAEVVSKEEVLGKPPSQDSQPGNSMVPNGVGAESPKIPGEGTQVDSDRPQVQTAISINGVVHVDEPADNLSEGRGKKRTVECAAPVVETTRPTRIKKRARDAWSSTPAGRQRNTSDQSGQHQAGSSVVEAKQPNGVIQNLVGASSSLPPAIPQSAVSVHQVSGADCDQSIGQTSHGKSSATCSEICGPNSVPLVPNPPTEKQVETVAKDVYSLRAIRAISRSLPVQRQLATAAAAEESEATESDINHVVLPKEEIEPEILPLKDPLPASSSTLGPIEDCVGDLFQVYSFLRSFSHALFLSPFGLEEFVVALTSTSVSPMLDCIHVSLLQGLRRHLEKLSKNSNNSATFCLRLLDWTLLDNITWPSFLMAYALTQGFLEERGWSFQAGLIRIDYYKLPADKKLAYLNFLCDKAMETEDVRGEINRRISAENDSEIVETKACNSKRPDRRNREVLSLENEFEEEFERMTRQKRESLSQKAGVQGLVPGKTTQAGEPKHLERGEDGNLDECILCGMDGVLICCDGCPAAYHSRCVGITKQGLPPGEWFCPECRADKLDSKGVRIPKGVRGGDLLFVGAENQRFFATCGYLLISESSSDTDSFYRYYSPGDMPRVVKYLEDAGPRYAPLQAAVQQLCQPDLDFSSAANQPILAAQVSGSISVEDKKGDSPVVADIEGDPKLTSGTSPSSSPSVPLVKLDTAACLEPPIISGIEGTPHKENLPVQADANASDVDLAVTPKVDPARDLSNGEGAPEDTLELRAIEHSPEGAPNQRAEPHSPLRTGGACGAQMNTETVTDVASGGDMHTPFNGWGELNIEQKDGVTDSGKPIPIAHYMYAKLFPRQVESNFSSLTQINACAYINKYTNGDIVFTAATYLSAMASNAEDASDDKGGSQKKVKPSNTADQLKAFSQAAPNFFWPSLKKRAMEAPKEKCGWCVNCRTPNRKGCLLTQVTGQISGGAAGVSGGIKPIKGPPGHYAAVAAYMLYMEETLHGLLDGPWEVAGYRKAWRKRVEQGMSIEDVRRALLEMEFNLRKIALSADWEKVVEDAPPFISNYVISVSGAGAAGPKKGAPKRRGRPPTVSKTPAVFAYDGGCFGVKWWRGGKLSRQVYNWESLPRAALKRAARQGGMKEIPELVYSKTSDLPRRTQQQAWRAKTEKISAVAQLAVQVRCLDKYIKWTEIVSPWDASTHNIKSSVDNKMTKADILSKSEEDGCIKYLLYIPKDGADVSDSTHQQLDLANGNATSKKVPSAGSKEGGSEQWSLDKDVPLWLLKDYEQKRRKSQHVKLHKSVKFRKLQTPVVERKLSFWDMISDPHLYDSHEPLKLSNWICGFCHLSCLNSQSIQCQRCTEKFHIACTEVEETIDGRDKVAVCKSCAKLRLSQRNRKPSYKIRSMQSHYPEGSFVGASKGIPMGDADEVGGKSGSNSKSSRKKDRGSSMASHSSPEKDDSPQGRRKSGQRRNGLLSGSEHESSDSEERDSEKRAYTRLSADSSHLLANSPGKGGGRSKSGRKLKSLQAVGRELHLSPDTVQVERRTSSRIKNSMSPSKCPAVNEDEHVKVKLKIGKSLPNHTPAVSGKEDENRLASKRNMGLSKDGAPSEAEFSEDDFEFALTDKKKSPQKRKRLKVLLKGLPITSEDADSPNPLVRNEKRKASNGLQYVRRKKKSDEDVARFRQERLVFAGHVDIDPNNVPRCSLCSEGYDPAYSFISCEWCEEWYHGDAVGLTQEDVPLLMGFKCHKCRKCRAPSCPISGTRQRPAAKLTTSLSSIGEHNVNLWASNTGSGQLDLPSDFSSPLDLSSRGTAALSFTELLASDDDYLEGVAGPEIPLGTAWVDAPVSASGVASGAAAWCGADGVDENLAGAAEWNNRSAGLAGTSGAGASADWSRRETTPGSSDLDPAVGWTAAERLAVPTGVGPVAGWTGGEGSASMAPGARWVGPTEDLPSAATPLAPDAYGGAAAFTSVQEGPGRPSSLVAQVQADPEPLPQPEGKESEGSHEQGVGEC
ncbi:protein MpPTM1 [Marchantia polymorpha subsp. ruderalis]|uniref:PHD-type domain-containing protein n=2 Tax=Marchantia polymorpha TaxID=3197 RepID=A0AAF6B5V8_MARPO|nr:hypothetical protein MARPO_0044s0125 [Marchantia polymorpha]BBN07392.1 hypothetical protein Mp_4g03480 [Marchantia polymorpha subsp. ruderalis]|eukprot:PTQ39709.1 hypothetical protein MARPO_0044s0125 [Marchantia polymorpha]